MADLGSAVTGFAGYFVPGIAYNNVPSAVTGFAGYFQSSFSYDNLYRTLMHAPLTAGASGTGRVTATHPTPTPSPNGNLIILAPNGGVRG